MGGRELPCTFWPQREGLRWPLYRAACECGWVGPAARDSFDAAFEVWRLQHANTVSQMAEETK